MFVTVNEVMFAFNETANKLAVAKSNVTTPDAIVGAVLVSFKPVTVLPLNVYVPNKVTAEDGEKSAKSLAAVMLESPLHDFV